ncbi:MAG: hypothetical protein ACP5E9_09215 [Candidatus Methanospirareceae archaeon]
MNYEEVKMNDMKRVMKKEDMKRSLSGLVVLVLVLVLGSISSVAAQQQSVGFEPVDHTYIYDINTDGSTQCTWSTTIIPRESSLLYTYTFRGGEASEYAACDSLGQELEVDVSEVGAERTINVLLLGYERNVPYQFNLSFLWTGLLLREGDRHTLYTSVDVGEPQSAKIVVIPPPGATTGLSSVTRGDLTEVFDRSVAADRTVLTWQTPNTGNETEIIIRANYRYYNPTYTLLDNLTKIVIGAAIVVVAALLLGYRKRLSGVFSKLKEKV